MDTLKKRLLTQIKYAAQLYDQFESTPTTLWLGNQEENVQRRVTAFVVAALTAIQHSAGDESVYYRQSTRNAEYIFTHRCYSPGIIYFDSDVLMNLASLRGVLQTVWEAVRQGHLASPQELIRAEVFKDFLDVAQHLFDSGYMDAAAVIAGTVLEQRLRHLSSKYQIITDATDSAGKLYPKKAETLNTELAGQKVYGKNEQKQVTAWLGIRNSAAHGKYDEYTHAQVELLLQGIRGFLARYPA